MRKVALLFLLTCWPLVATAQFTDCANQLIVVQPECEALVALYHATEGDNWDNNTGWLADSLSTWYGVTTQGGHVYRLLSIGTLHRTGYTNVPAEPAIVLPEAFSLEGNYPNPFNPSTQIRYLLPNAASIRLSVYDAQGRRVAVLEDAPQPAGQYEVAFEAETMPSGVYFYGLEADPYKAVRPMPLLK